MMVRLIVTAAVLVCGGLTARGTGHGEPVKLREPFSRYPLKVGDWTGRAMQLSGEIQKRVGVSDYLYRVYVRNGVPMHLYVGYYETQRHGEMIHSPKNCLPGSGWYIAKRESTTLEFPGVAPFDVNKFTVENGIERQLVLYWYEQTGGRIVTNEYLGRVHLVLDALRRNRTDAALIRLSVPFEGSDEATAMDRANSFLREAYPRLKKSLPAEVPAS